MIIRKLLKSVNKNKIIDFKKFEILWNFETQKDEINEEINENNLSVEENEKENNLLKSKNKNIILITNNNNNNNNEKNKENQKINNKNNKINLTEQNKNINIFNSVKRFKNKPYFEMFKEKVVEKKKSKNNSLNKKIEIKQFKKIKK
jgi:hypothetical protein